MPGFGTYKTFETTPKQSRFGSTYASKKWGRSDFCSKYNHKHCKGIRNLQRTGKPCDCDCHEENNVKN